MNSAKENSVLVWAENLGVTYYLGDMPAAAVKNVNLRIMRGEFIAVTGLHGLARKHFLNTVGCIEKPSTGRFIFDYTEIQLTGRQELSDIRKQKIGFLFSDCKLLDYYSVCRNVELPLKYCNMKPAEKQQRVEEALAKVEFDGEASDKISCLNELQKQQAALARAIVNKPLLLIVSEPTAELTAAQGEKFMSLLESLNTEGMTVVLITDTPLAAARAARHIEFREGVLAGESGKGACEACGQ